MIHMYDSLKGVVLDSVTKSFRKVEVTIHLFKVNVCVIDRQVNDVANLP